MEETTSVDSSALQNILGGAQANLIPESLVTTLTVGFIVLNVLGVLFLIAYIFGIIRKWKVQSAVLHMQKDLAEIKASLVPTTDRQAAEPNPGPEPVAKPSE